MSKYDLAFPFNQKDAEGNPYDCHLGLTKREYFAGLAMQGMVLKVAAGLTSPHDFLGDMATNAVKHADVLIAELAKAD